MALLYAHIERSSVCFLRGVTESVMLYAELWTEENPLCRYRGSLWLVDNRFGYEQGFYFLNEKPAE